jgi:RNA polymerase sigma factor (TIGR02999 family)
VPGDGDRSEPGGHDAGEGRTAEALLPLVYRELRQLAAHRLAHEAPGQTLQATALVHEAYLRLVASRPEGAPGWNGRGHFYAAAARAMRRILVDRARAKGCAKRGGDWQRASDELAAIAPDAAPAGLLELDEALAALAAADPDKARLVELRFFAGLTMQEAADALGVSIATAGRQWAYARAWLFRRLTGADGGARRPDGPDATGRP